MRRPALGLAKFVAECAGGGGIEPLGGCGAAEDVNRPPFVLNVGADAAALSRAAAARKAVVCAAEPSLAVRRGKWKFVWETGALDVRCGQPLKRSPNLGASGGAGCDEPGPAAVTGAVVAGAGAVTGAGAAGAGAVTGVVAGAAAVVGWRCVVAIAPRPLLTDGVKSVRCSVQTRCAVVSRTRTGRVLCQRCWDAAAGLNRPAAALASSPLRLFTRPRGGAKRLAL